MKARKAAASGRRGILVSAAMLLGLIALGVAILVGGTGAQDRSGLPAYALVSADVKEAYLFATQDPGELDGVNCHCGCMLMPHNGRIHKRGLLDCFLKDDGTYDPHASTCPQCIADTLRVKNLMTEGTAKDRIKQIIDAQYVTG
ncbi:MAG TPA: PCYCGC motif-containing (lipo)protein [Methanomicrobiales archaeon]|nr:PCYCGC motif-containing (lipo)protein [Methanomicrobiales archaeon]